MKYFYYKLALIISLCCGISCVNANPTLKQCIDKCHKKSLNLKDFKHCKQDCHHRVKKRKAHKKYQKNYDTTPAEVMPSVETTVRAATPAQAEVAAAAATGAAASVLSATSPQAMVVEQQTEQPVEQFDPDTATEVVEE